MATFLHINKGRHEQWTSNIALGEDSTKGLAINDNVLAHVADGSLLIVKDLLVQEAVHYQTTSNISLGQGDNKGLAINDNALGHFAPGIVTWTFLEINDATHVSASDFVIFSVHGPAEVTLGGMSVSALGGAAGQIVLEAAQVDGAGTVGAVIAADIRLPSMTLSGSGSRGILGTGDFKLPRMSMEGSISLSPVGETDMDLPILDVAAYGTTLTRFSDIELRYAR